MYIFKEINEYLYWNSHLAGWGQAIGGVLTIIAAFMIARGDRYAVRAEQARRQTGLEDAILDLGARATASGLVFLQLLNDENQWQSISKHGMDLHPISDAILEIDNFPTHEMERSDISFHLKRLRLQLKSNIDVIQIAIEIIKDCGGLDKDSRGRLCEMMKKIDDISSDILQSINEAQNGRKSKTLLQRLKFA
jgi:hypothetical protein